MHRCRIVAYWNKLNFTLMKKSWVQEKANVVLSSPFEAANMMLVRKKNPKNKSRRQRFVRTSWSSQNSLSLMLQRRQLASRSASARLANRISPPLSGKLNVLSCPFRYRHFQNQLKEKLNKHSTICFSIGTFTPARLMWPSPQCSASTGWLRSLGWSRWWR